MALAKTNFVTFDLIEVARRCGVKILKPVTNNQWLARCPFCGDSKNKRHGHLYLKPDTGEYICQRCGEGGYTIGFYARLRGISTKEAYRELLQSGEMPEIYQKTRPIEKENPVASLELRHRVYTALLKKLTLLPIHRADLLKRGLTHKMIVRNGYKSYPLDKGKRLVICQELSKDYNLKHVPGFYTDKSGTWNISDLPNGYFLPVRNLDGKIQGLQIRVFPFNEQCHNSKFFWLSSLGKPNGAGASNWLHATVPHGQKINDRIWLTEGALKADIASYYIKTPFFAIPGTSASKDILDVLENLQIKQVVMAFDADQLTKKTVKEFVNKLNNEIKSAKIATIPATWPVEIKDGEVIPKGIDDACLERAMKSLEINEEVFTLLAKTVTQKVTWDVSGNKPTVTVEKTVTHKYEVKKMATFFKKIFRK